MLLFAEGEDKTKEVINEHGERVTTVLKKGIKSQQVVSEVERLSAGKNVALGKMLRWKVRYFSDGAVIGSREFVDGFFEQCRERFGSKRKSGARKMRGNAAAAEGVIWSARDLRQGVD